MSYRGHREKTPTKTML